MRAALRQARVRVHAAARLVADLPRWLAIARARPAADGVRVYYGRDSVAGRAEVVHGGAVKFQALADAFPNALRDFNILYLGSTTTPRDAAMLLRLARRRGARVVWNQNGVAYPGWHGEGYERTNAPRARALHAADHVVFQSDFCKLSADRFYGERRGPWEVLHNPVDTERFTPGPAADAAPTLLLGGNQYQPYRLECALRTLALLPDEWRLLVTGSISWHPDRRLARREAEVLLDEVGVRSRVDLTGPYTQEEAPALIRRGRILLHTKYNDPCPTIVLEAMASGLPVVYSASGGTPELVGPEAGVGVEAPLDWKQDHPPAPERLAAAVLRVDRDLERYAGAARDRARRFDVRPWIERHRELFASLSA